MGKPFDYNPIALNYSKTRSSVQWVIEPLNNAVKDLPADSGILDIGCGTGNYIIELSNTLHGYDYYGFDISDKMLKVARSRSDSVKFLNGDAEKAFPFKDGIFYLCFAVDVIHHIVDIRNIFSEIFRCLKTKGKFILVTDLEENIKKRSLSKFFPEILNVEMERYPSLELIISSAGHAGLHHACTILAEGYRNIDDEFIESVKRKCSSSMRLITDEQHQKGLERIRIAKEKGEKWFSSYSVMNFIK
jgi:SAM-dependent methyltransferase